MIYSKQQGKIEFRVLSLEEHHQTTQQWNHQSSFLRIIEYDCRNTITISTLRTIALIVGERDVYVWFNCVFIITVFH